jgi:hypothetical protein
MSELDTIAQKLVHSTRFHLASRRFGRRFHLFSLDFALDEDLNLWLFEANNSPGLDIEHEQIQTSLISPLIDGLIDVAIDPLLTEAPPQASSDWSIWLD